MISSSSRSMRCRRITEHRLRRCRRQPNPNSCIGGAPMGPHGGAGRRQAAVGARSRRQRPRRAWRCWWRSALLVPALGWLTWKPQTLAGRASGPVTAASRMAVVAESSVAPPCDEVGRRIHHSSTLSYSPTAVRRSTQGAARRMITQRPIRPARQQAAPPCLAPREWPRGIRGCSCTPKLP
jgi:hypothetical protein